MEGPTPSTFCRSRGGDDPVEGGKPVEQRAPDGFHVTPRIGAEQDHFQQFVIRHRIGTAGQQAVTQPRAVIADV